MSLKYCENKRPTVIKLQTTSIYGMNRKPRILGKLTYRNRAAGINGGGVKINRKWATTR